MVENQLLLTIYAKAIKDNFAIVNNATKGVDAKAFFDLVSYSQLSKQKLSEEILHLSLKTIKRYKADEKKFSPQKSELLLKLFVLYKKGIEVFGKLESFNRWIEKPAFGIGNKIPVKLMNTSMGIDLIMEELYRIEFGDLA